MFVILYLQVNNDSDFFLQYICLLYLAIIDVDIYAVSSLSIVDTVDRTTVQNQRTFQRKAVSSYEQEMQ